MRSSCQFSVVSSRLSLVRPQVLISSYSVAGSTCTISFTVTQWHRLSNQIPDVGIFIKRSNGLRNQLFFTNFVMASTKTSRLVSDVYTLGVIRTPFIFSHSIG